MAKVRWFNFAEEIDGLIPQSEVFVMPYEREISAKCIASIVAVLTPIHMEENMTFSCATEN